jgi:hypothetical protein
MKIGRRSLLSAAIAASPLALIGSPTVAIHFARKCPAVDVAGWIPSGSFRPLGQGFESIPPPQ